MLKVKNNAGEIIEVTQLAWDVLYKHRDDFELYVEEKKTPAKKTPAKKTSTAKKKVKKDESK